MKEENTQRRSKLNTKQVIKWLNTRYINKDRRNHHYLFSPEELTRQREIQKIFVQFDSDGSGGLSRQEVFDMFQGFGISMPMDKINELYDSVQANLEQLDLQKFKQCALSEKSGKVFAQIVKSLGFHNYMPVKFTEMITYLVYLSKRQELTSKINDLRLNGEQRTAAMDNLLNLQELSHNNKRLNINLQQERYRVQKKFKNIYKEVSSNLGYQFKMDSDILKQIKIRYQQKQKNPESIGPLPFYNISNTITRKLTKKYMNRTQY